MASNHAPVKTLATEAPATGRRAAPLWLAPALLSGALLWSYWPTLAELWAFWQVNDDYSVGQLVPLVAAYLVWSRRARLRALPIRCWWWGLPVLLCAQCVRFVGLYYNYGSLERYSIVLTVVGICMLLLGPAVFRALRWLWLFLFLMVPLPGRVHEAVALPLQTLATHSAVFVLELLGYWVVREGNVMVLNEHTRVAVAEACSGLRMLTAFVVVSGALAFVIDRRTWQKLTVVFSSIPIAVAANALRLTVTVILFDSTSNTLAEKFFHDLAGVVMIPVAILLVMGELSLMRRLDGSHRRVPEMARANAAPQTDGRAQGRRPVKRAPAATMK